MERRVDDWIAIFRKAFDQVTVIPREEWDLVDVYALSDQFLGLVVNQGPHQFGRRYRLTTLNRGFRPTQDPQELAMILIIGEILEPHASESRPSALATERRHPRAIWGGESPVVNDVASLD